MKSSHLLTIVATATLLVALTPAVGRAQQCIPSCDEKDAKMLAITDGAGLDTLTDQALDISVRADAAEGFFRLGFFDGETSGLWDLYGPSVPPPPVPPAPELLFTLYADPLGDGSCHGDGVDGCDATDVVAVFDGETMPDNAWFDIDIANDPRALAPEGALHVYLLRAELGGILTPPPIRSVFKVRTGIPERASIEVFQQPFSFIAALPGGDEVEIVYPGCAGEVSTDPGGLLILSPACLASLGESNYDGTFSFFIEEVQPQTEFVVWDGDLDHGDFGGAVKDDDDPNTLPGIAGLPPWACVDPFLPCDDPANPPLPVINFEEVAMGIPGSSGSPPDDFNPPIPPFPPAALVFLRSPSITYEIYAPDGSLLATNMNPSGNQEWEIFCLGVPGTSECKGFFGGVLEGEDGTKGELPDQIVPELPAGVYEVRVTGLDMENLNAFRFGGRAVPVPCDECKGGVVELTLEYNGTLDPDPTIRVEKDSNTVYFEGPVGPGGRFTFQGTGSDNKMGSNIKLFVNGVLNTEIHTSCSQPIFPGQVAGDFTIVEGFSKDNGLICVDIGCDECDGGVTDLTFRYDGAAPVELAIYDDDKVNADKVLFGPATVNPGEEIAITKRPGQDKFSSNISLWVDGVKLALHTSCSQPIGPGIEIGDFVIVSGASRNGGDLCPLDTPGCGECKGGVTELAFRNVTGAPVAVEIYDDADAKADKLLFAATLDVDGETGTLTGSRSDGKFNGDVSIWVGGQRVAKIHTSCSQPIGVGLVFGGFEVVAGASKDNGEFCPADCQPTQLNFEVKDDELKLKIGNDGTTPLQIQKIVLEWPEDKGELEKIEFDGTIFDQDVPWQPGPVAITQFIGEPKNRALKAGDDHDLKFRFADKTTTGLHSVRVEFNSGCFLEASSDTPPGGGPFECSKDIDALTMIWQPEASSPAAGQDVHVKAWKDSPGEILVDEFDVALGAEHTVSGYAPKDGNDVVWEVFDASGTVLLGSSQFHLSCSDSDMNGPEDCGKRAGDGKGNDSSLLNDWLFEGMVDSDETLDCTP